MLVVGTQKLRLRARSSTGCCQSDAHSSPPDAPPFARPTPGHERLPLGQGSRAGVQKVARQPSCVSYRWPSGAPPLSGALQCRWCLASGLRPVLPFSSPHRSSFSQATGGGAKAASAGARQVKITRRSPRRWRRAQIAGPAPSPRALDADDRLIASRVLARMRRPSIRPAGRSPLWQRKLHNSGDGMFASHSAGSRRLQQTFRNIAGVQPRRGRLADRLLMPELPSDFGPTGDCPVCDDESEKAADRLSPQSCSFGSLAGASFWNRPLRARAVPFLRLQQAASRKPIVNWLRKRPRRGFEETNLAPAIPLYLLNRDRRQERSWSYFNSPSRFQDRGGAETEGLIHFQEKDSGDSSHCGQRPSRRSDADTASCTASALLSQAQGRNSQCFESSLRVQ